MKYRFFKMQSAGNDYIYFDFRKTATAFTKENIISLSSRRFGVGGDGVVCIEKSEVADAKMRMFNADGSEGKMCGNAIRCVGKYLYLQGKKKKILRIETQSGIKTLYTKNGENIKVDLGRPVFTPKEIPVLMSERDGVAFDRKIKVGDREFIVSCVSVGNPHAVVFGKFCENDFAYAERISRHFLFPDGVNVEFCERVGENEFFVRVYERGSGETYACGTGACAVVSVAKKKGYITGNQTVAVRMKGGTLFVDHTGENLCLSGDTQFVFSGVVDINL